MKPYGIRSMVEHPDVGDIQAQGRKTSVGGKRRGYQKSRKKQETRRYFKRIARAEGRRDSCDGLED